MRTDVAPCPSEDVAESLVEASPRFICIFCEIGQKSKKRVGLAAEKAHVSQELDHATGNALRLGRSNDRTRGQFATKKRGMARA